MFWSAANIWRATGDVSVLYTVITWAFSYLDVKSDISVLQLELCLSETHDTLQSLDRVDGYARLHESWHDLYEHLADICLENTS